MLRRLVITAVFLFAFAAAAPAEGARIKDLVDVEGFRENGLTGLGIVTGLAGTGDDQQVVVLRDVLSSIMRTQGIFAAPPQLLVKNAALVIVEAKLPPFARPGTKIDVHVSSVGSAKSLLGGSLFVAPLKGADGRIYAVAQGPITVGGFSAGANGSGTQKNHVTAGRIPGGATVELAGPAVDFANADSLRLNLKTPDFTTVMRLVQTVNKHLGSQGLPATAAALGPRSVGLSLGEDFPGGALGLLAAVEPIDIIPDERAKVVVNERTGTVIVNQAVRVSAVAVAHGNLTVNIDTTFDVSQPAPFGEGETVVVPQSKVEVEEEADPDAVALKALPPSVTVQELVESLNSIGATPRDLITIFQALETAGALQAELVVQ